MSLSTNKLNKYLIRNNIDSGNLSAWYGFNQASGHVLFNEKYPDTQVYSMSNVNDGFGADEIVGGGRCVNDLSNPSYLIGSGANSFSFENGSGYFDSESIFRFANKFFTGADGFTIIANLGNFDNQQNLDKGKTLFTTMKSSTDASGFSVGINGLNRVYFHYVGVDGKVDRSLSTENELNNYCVFSISCKPYYSYTEAIPRYVNGEKVGEEKIQKTRESYFDYAYHDITNVTPNAEADWSIVSCRGCVDFKPSESLYVGDFYTQSEGYTGYKGYMSDLLIFSGVLSIGQRHDISRGFFTESIMPSAFVPKDIQEKVVTGSGVFSMGITGTGITGYENVQLNQPLLTRTDDVIGETCTVMLSGLEGPLYGEVASYETSTGIINRTVLEFVPELIEYDAEDYRPYAKKALAFYEPLDSNDIFETYSYTGRSDRINRQAFINLVPALLDWEESPISSCENHAKAMCPEWVVSGGKVCYPCGFYTGNDGCGECYKTSGEVSYESSTDPAEWIFPIKRGCGDDDTCESGFSSIAECRGFVFDECLKRTDAPVGGFDLKQTIVPSQIGFSPYIDKYVSDFEYLTSGGNLFINGLLSKPGQEVCEVKYASMSYGLKASNPIEVCNLKSGKYIITDGHNAYYSGKHSFDIRYRYDYYSPGGERVFSDSYKYVAPISEFTIFDDTFDDGLNSPSGDTLYLKYTPGSSNLSFNEDSYVNKDIYLNGQKLISGLNYTGNAEGGIDLIRSSLPDIEDAQLSFSSASVYGNRLTGSNVGNYKKFDFGMLSEKVWINGIRQAEGIDYIKISDASLLAGTILKSKPAIIYGNYGNFFNDEIQTGFKV